MRTLYARCGSLYAYLVRCEALTIRKLATAVGTKPMTTYRHVASKEEIVDGMVERVFAEIERPPADGDWLDGLRRRCVSAKAALNRRPWAAPRSSSASDASSTPWPRSPTASGYR